MNVDEKMGTPFVNVGLDFKSPAVRHPGRLPPRAGDGSGPRGRAADVSWRRGPVCHGCLAHAHVSGGHRTDEKTSPQVLPRATNQARRRP
jgi:hypothetical protein